MMTQVTLSINTEYFLILQVNGLFALKSWPQGYIYAAPEIAP